MMMTETYYYSAKMGHFFADSMKESYENSQEGWPSDAVVVKDKDYVALFAGQSTGQRIIPNKKGYPVLADQPPASPEMLLFIADTKKTQLMQQANNAIAPLQDAVDLGVATEKEVNDLKAWKEFRIALGRLDLSADVIVWPKVPK